MKVVVTVEKSMGGNYEVTTDKDDNLFIAPGPERAIRLALSVLAQEIFLDICEDWKKGEAEQADIDECYEAFHNMRAMKNGTHD